MFKKQRGVAHVLLLVFAVGILAFILISNTVSFKNGLFSYLFPKPLSHASSEKLFGVNVAVAEFGENNLPGTRGTTYGYPSTSYGYNSYSYFNSKGLSLVRVPFRWERVQGQYFGPLTSADISDLRKVLDEANAQGMKVILDMHNYARFKNGSTEVMVMKRADADKLADVWKKLAAEFKNHPALWGYEIMNEPHDLPEGDVSWLDISQATVNAIRMEDMNHYILIPGNSWQSADRWPQASDVLKNITDPADSSLGKILFSAHQYFDEDASGGDWEACVSSDIGVTRVNNFLNWLDSNALATGKNFRGILTEYGARSDGICLQALDNFLNRLNSHPRIVGGTYWAAGPWWGDYGYSVEPSGGIDKGQMGILAKYPTVMEGPILTTKPTVAPTALPATDPGGVVELLEAESMSLPTGNGQVFDDWDASGRKGLLIWSNARATSMVTTLGGNLVIKAKADLCNGAPHMTVSVGGNQVFETLVSDTSYTEFEVPVVLTAGVQATTIEVGFDNDISVPGVCDRNLRLDVLQFKSSASVPTATPVTTGDTLAPTVTITKPVNGILVSRNSQQIIGASSTDNIGVTKVEFYINNQLVGADYSVPYSYTWKVPGKPANSFLITAKAYDAANNSSNSSITVKTVR